MIPIYKHMKILIALLLCFLTGCSTMAYQDGSSNDPQKEQPIVVVPDIPYQVIENLIGSDSKPALIMRISLCRSARPIMNGTAEEALPAIM